ncbi:hypothetical protein EDB84DRAFT_1626704 [Lactarius hengduanensis]|nr:hypothetical protein EDB84DRAFT_1626704 [Lactarius hengduanensis]
MLLDLPVNILSKVLVLLDNCSILRYSRYSFMPSSPRPSISNTASNSRQGALIDGPSRGPASTAAARMDLLLERRVAWRVMRPRRRAAVALAGPCHAYELAGGLFAKAIEEFRAAPRLVASWLPSNTADETRLVIDDLGVRIKDFALDPSQDLIVFLEHPSSTVLLPVPLGAGAVAPHPAAKVPVLCRRSPGPVHGCMIQVVEDIVGVYFWMPLHGVLIWNWMTGEELVFVQGDQVPERIWEFSFLSPRAYMITTLKDGGEIHIYSFASPSSPRQPTHVATLHLPTPHPTRALFEFTTTTGPFLTRPPIGSPFSFARTARPACFVMHNRTLMRYVEAYCDDGASAMDVPWEEWGPTETRFFVLAMGFQWLRYVHGTRVVCPVLQPSGECLVEVLDFNVRASRAPTVAEKLAASRLGIDIKEPVEGSRLVCEPSVFPAAGIFAKEVVTRLPYYSVPAPGQHEPYVGYMIDEQRLLWIKALTAKVIFEHDAVSITTDQRNTRQYIGRLTLRVVCKQFDWQIDCAAQIRSVLMPALSGAEMFKLDFYGLTMPSFIGAKELFIYGALSRELSRALQV